MAPNPGCVGQAQMHASKPLSASLLALHRAILAPYLQMNHPKHYNTTHHYAPNLPNNVRSAGREGEGNMSVEGSDTFPVSEFAGYRLTGILGNGGTSTVYRAERISDPREESAIKVLREYPVVADSHANFRSRFYREAETASSLRHDHILPVLDYGEWQELPYMVMPLATGGTLGTLVAQFRSRFLLADAATYATQLASALDYAHQHGIVHRDVKPANALLNGQGNLLLADFGIARLYEHSAHESQTTTLTYDGEVIGTPYYMAPEQLQGLRVGPAADIYALGVVLYLLVTGRLPFEGETPLAVGMAHLNETPLSPQLLRMDLPLPAATAILAALSKEPTRRFESAGSLAQAFAEGVAGNWTAENRERAESLDGEPTFPVPISSWLERSRSGIRRLSPVRRAGLIAVTAAMLLGGSMVAQAIQNGDILSSSQTAQIPVVHASAQEAARGAPAVTLRADGPQVYALWPDGSRRWTVWLDGAPVGTPRISGDDVYLTTVKGTSYILSASSGAILSRTPVVTQQNNQNNQNNQSDSGKHGKGHGKDGGDSKSGKGD